MQRMFARRMSHVLTGTGVDDVLVGMSLPSGTVIHDIRIHSQVVGGTAIALARDVAAMYATALHILPILDPDSGPTMEAVFDTLVVKDTDAATIDYDTGSADTAPFFEPGEHDPMELFNIGVEGEKLYQRERLLTAASPGSMNFLEGGAGEAGNMLWSPRDDYRVHIGRKLRVDVPSILVFAQASPSLDDTTTTVYTAMVENRWAQVKYITEVLTRAMMNELGLIETGAETPWEEASAVLREHLEPDVFEETAGAFTSEQFNVFTTMMVDHSVPGTMEGYALSSN